MNLSMDGFRNEISRNIEELKEIVTKVIDGSYKEYSDKDELVDAMNDVIRKSNALNSVYFKGCKDFTNMSHIRIPELGEETSDISANS